jgi:S1-C subfamily serine protease
MGIAVRRGPGMIGALVFGVFLCGTPPQDLSIPDVVERVAPAVVSVYSSLPVGRGPFGELEVRV